MDLPLEIALIAVSGTILVGLINTFFIEHYRRFRDSKNLAAALAGELGAYSETWITANESISALLQLIEEEGAQDLPKIEKQTDRVFDSCVANIGLLGPDLAKEVAYVYNQLSGARLSLTIATETKSKQVQINTLTHMLQLGRKIYDMDSQQKLIDFSQKKYYRTMEVKIIVLICFVILVVAIIA